MSENYLFSPPRASAEEVAAYPNAQDKYWALGKGVRLGPLLFDFGGQARVRRYENDEGDFDWIAIDSALNKYRSPGK